MEPALLWHNLAINPKTVKFQWFFFIFHHNLRISEAVTKNKSYHHYTNNLLTHLPFKTVPTCFKFHPGSCTYYSFGVFSENLNLKDLKVTNNIKLISTHEINQNLKLIFCVNSSFTLIILYSARNPLGNRQHLLHLPDGDTETKRWPLLPISEWQDRYSSPDNFIIKPTVSNILWILKGIRWMHTLQIHYPLAYTEFLEMYQLWLKYWHWVSVCLNPDSVTQKEGARSLCSCHQTQDGALPAGLSWWFKLNY